MDRKTFEIVIKENAKILIGRTVKHSVRGSGVIKTIESANTCDDELVLGAIISFKDKECEMVISQGNFERDAETNEFINMAVTELKEIYKQELSAEQFIKADMKKAQLAAKEELRMQQLHQRLQQNYDARKAEKIGATEDEETWLRNHIVSITAEMPDFMVKQFKYDHNPDDNAVRSVDSGRKTSGGYSMKYGYSFKVCFDTADNQPACVASKSRGSKTISDVGFVLDLVYNHGYRFGRKGRVIAD